MATDKSPQFKVFGRSNRLAADELLGLHRELEPEKAMSDEEIEKYRQIMKKDHDQKWGTIPEIVENEMILVQSGHGKATTTTGPFKVVEGSSTGKPYVIYKT